MATVALKPDQIQQILTQSRQRGVYDAELAKFLESEEVGVMVDLQNGTFAGKKPQTIKTGFESATKRENAPELAKNVAVRVVNDNVYLIRTDLV